MDPVRGEGIDIAGVFYEQWLPMVRLATLILGDQGLAEDVVQDVFADMYRNAEHLDPDRVLGYLRVSVINRSRSAGKRRPLVLSADTAPERFTPVGSGPDAHAVRADQERRVLAVLDRLPQRQREIVVLRYWMDLSEAEIATTLGISAGTVKSSASRAMRTLSSQLGEWR
jgi:RNA polymerase sigma-70 factor (sigma-E family)